MTDTQEPQDELQVSYLPPKHSRVTGTVVISQGDTKHAFQMNILKIGEIEKAVNYVCEKWPALNTDEGREIIRKRLETCAADQVGSEEDEPAIQQSQADKAVEIVQDADLFHNPGGYDSEGFITLDLDSHKETWSVKSQAIKRWLSKEFYDRHGKVPSSQALQDALNVIAGQAIHSGNEHEVFIRFAKPDDAIWIDLADSAWRAIEVTKTGWRVVASKSVPVHFIRRRGMLPLPAPVKGGSINDLRPLVNIPDDDAWMLFVGWLLMAFNPKGSYPVLAVNGEQGSAKSTLCKFTRALVDPNQAPLRRPPKSERDLMITAGNSWICAFDNLRGLPPWLSDCLCSLATGTGFGARELYTDDDEKLFQACRPIMLNGIEDIATREDLADRAVNLALPRISESQCRRERELLGRFERARPGILGALLDVVSAALENKDRVKTDKLPRMADFAAWIMASEPVLGWEPGAFMAAYKENRQSAKAQALEASAIGPLIVEMMEAKDDWEGTAGDLLDELDERADDRTRKRKDWPRTPRKISGDLRRIAPLLRDQGIEVTFPGREPGGQRRRLLLLEKVPAKPSQSAQSAQSAQKAGKTATESGRYENTEPSRNNPNRPETVPRDNPSEGVQGHFGTVGTVGTVVPGTFSEGGDANSQDRSGDPVVEPKEASQPIANKEVRDDFELNALQSREELEI